MDCIYCTPEWLEESVRIYRATPSFQEKMKRLSVSVFYRVIAEPDWGIDQDFIFGAIVTNGALDELRFYSEDEAKKMPEIIMAASPQQWKLLLRKEHKFVTDFLLGKIKLEKGNMAGALGMAPYAETFIDALTQVNLQFQDELNPQQLNDYRVYAAQFRSKLGV
jgi:hypothetical protein